jgi:FtsH-binding integral membrane protein
MHAHPTDSPQPHLVAAMESPTAAPGTSIRDSTRPLSRVAWTLARRWPAALGLTVAVFMLATDDPRSLSAVVLPLMLATTTYVVVAALTRPGWSWTVIAVLVVLVVATRLAAAGSAVDLAGMVAIILAAIVVGVVHGIWARPDLYRWQPYAAVAFLAVGLGALWLTPGAGRLLIGTGLIAHALWDLVHWRRQEVVSRSLAEWCCALDFSLGAGILVFSAWPPS